MFDHCLYFNTTALARQLEREWANAFQPFGLTPPQAFLLRAILRKPGMLQFELAALMGIARPTATRALDGLAAKALAERRATTEDGREWVIYPTDKAAQLLKQLDAASSAVTARIKKELGPDRFADTVDKVREARASLT